MMILVSRRGGWTMFLTIALTVHACWGFSSPKKAQPFVNEKVMPRVAEPQNTFQRVAGSAAMAILLLTGNLAPAILPGGMAHADSRLIGEVKGSGLVFKVRKEKSMNAL